MNTTGTLTVLTAHATTIQDLGRPGYTPLGVSPSGAWDPHAYKTVAALAADTAHPTPPVFENLAGDFTFTSSIDTTIAISGPTTVTIDGHRTATETTIHLHAGQTVTTHRTGPGPIYIAVRGLTVPTTLGSASTDTHGHLGPDLVTAGTTYPLHTNPTDTSHFDHIGTFTHPSRHHHATTTVRFLPHIDYLADYLTATPWRVAAFSRTGIKLTPDHNQHPTPPPYVPIVSTPVNPGAIQITPDGTPIVLGPDAGTTGGYPTAGNIITTDLHRTAYLDPTTPIRFLPTTIEQAHALLNRLPHHRIYRTHHLHR